MSNFNPGDYTTTSQGHNAPIQVQVAFSNDRIEKIEILEHEETTGVATPALEQIPASIVNNQSLAVDSVSGATVTSKALISAVSQAVTEAGGNVKNFQNEVKSEPDRTGEIDELITDVVVVGSGGAGLSAAAQILDEEKEVIVVEKSASVGGNTILSGGMMNADDPEWQKKDRAFKGELEALKGYAATPESEIAAEYLEDFHTMQKQIAAYEKDIEAGENYLFDSDEFYCIQTYLGGKREGLNGEIVYGDYELVKTLTEHSIDAVHFLQDKNVSFDHSRVQTLVGALWRRGHDSIGADFGIPFISNLENYVKDHEGQIILNSSVKTLLHDEENKVIGVEAERADGSILRIRARLGVILASGGFAANTPMVKAYDNYWGNIPDDVANTNAAGMTGDGIRMAEEMGAETVGMGYVQFLPIASATPGNTLKGFALLSPSDFLFVNKEGNRFVNEGAERDVLSKAMIENDWLFYVISDSVMKENLMSMTDESLAREVKNGDVYQADTIEDLAEQIDVPVENLRQSVEKFNTYVEEGYDPEFHKTSFDHPVEQGPFYATPCAPSVHHTMGGLKIDKTCHVLNKNDELIKGLYAAGEVAGGVHAGNRLGGNALTDIFVYGPIAGRSVVEDN